MSVVIPCYNYGHFLRGAVASALDNTGVDVDVLIVDDASPDGSVEVAYELATEDQRVTVLAHSRNMGHIETYNDGLKRATGDYTVLLSADDLLTKNSLRRATELMESHPDIGLTYGTALTFENEPSSAVIGAPSHWTTWSGNAWARAIYTSGRNALYSPEAVVRTSVMHTVGLYDPAHPHAGDLQMWLRIAAVSDIGFIAGTSQACYRMHAENMHSAIFASDQAQGMITDLRHRLAAFTDAAGRFANGDELIRLARKALAVEAIDLASRAYVWGLTKEWPVADLATFAFECYPAISITSAGRAYSRRVLLGHRVSRKNPAFVIRERKLSRRSEHETRLARQTGVGI